MELLSKAKLKLFASLRLKKQRYAHRLFVVEGAKMVQEAVQSGWPVHGIVVRKGNEDLLPPESKLPVWLAEEDSFAQINTLEAPEGLLAIVSFPDTDFTSPSLPPPPGLVLDGIQDPGNLGTILRVADWFGIPNVVCGPGTTDCLNPKALRASMGAIFRVAVTYVSQLPPLLHDQSGLWLAHLDGKPYTRAFAEGCNWLVIGNEANGLSPDLLRTFPDRRVVIPRLGGAESLNASVAAGILVAAWSAARFPDQFPP